MSDPQHPQACNDWIKDKNARTKAILENLKALDPKVDFCFVVLFSKCDKDPKRFHAESLSCHVNTVDPVDLSLDNIEHEIRFAWRKLLDANMVAQLREQANKAEPWVV